MFKSASRLSPKMPMPGAGACPSLSATAAGSEVGAGVPGGARCATRAETTGRGFAVAVRDGAGSGGSLEGSLDGLAAGGAAVLTWATAPGDCGAVGRAWGAGRRGRAGVRFLRGGLFGIGLRGRATTLRATDFKTGGRTCRRGTDCRSTFTFVVLEKVRIWMLSRLLSGLRCVGKKNVARPCKTSEASSAPKSRLCSYQRRRCNKKYRKVSLLRLLLGCPLYCGAQPIAPTSPSKK